MHCLGSSEGFLLQMKGDDFAHSSLPLQTSLPSQVCTGAEFWAAMGTGGTAASKLLGTREGESTALKIPVGVSNNFTKW